MIRTVEVQRFERCSTYIFFQRVQNQSLELTQALVDPRSAALLHDGFG